VLSLALDTATTWGRFALADGGRLLEYRPLNVSGSYADALLPMIQEILAAAGRTREEIGAVGVSCGPGSFTGVRIGVATAKGLAWALGCELVSVSTLEAMAGSMLAEHPDADLAVPVLDARRGEVFAAIYERHGGWVRLLDSPLAVPAAASCDMWWRRIGDLLDDVEAPVYAGDGTKLLLGQGDELRAELSGLGKPVLRRWSSSHPATAKALAMAMGSPEAAIPRIHPFALVPSYLRVSDAEVKRRVDLTPDSPGTEVEFHESRKDHS
jgi:tRNA threonylcarbamoyladenosine biosynthesis protein TsaB